MKTSSNGFRLCPKNKSYKTFFLFWYACRKLHDTTASLVESADLNLSGFALLIKSHTNNGQYKKIMYIYLYAYYDSK